MAAGEGATSAALVKKSAAAPAAPEVTPSQKDVDARPQEVPVPSAGLTPSVPILTATAEVARPPEPPVLPAAVASPGLVPRTSPLPPGAQLGHGAPAASGMLEEARAALNLLQGELQGPNRCAALGRLGLISGWLQADASVQAVWSSVEEAQKVSGMAAAERDLA